MKRNLLITLISIFLTPQIGLAERFIPRSDLITNVLTIIDKYYVDHNRVVPTKMLEGALDLLSSSIAPILTQMEKEEDRVRIEISVDQYKKAFQFKQPQDVKQLNEIFQQVAKFTKQYLEEKEPESVDYALINGSLKQLDPHTMLLIPDVYSTFHQESLGSFVGVGMTIGIRDDQLTVIKPMPESPASRAGLKPKDKIVQIDDESTINLPLKDAVKRIKGKEGTKVVLHIVRKDVVKKIKSKDGAKEIIKTIRKGFKIPKKFEIVRAAININSVESHVFEGEKSRVGYIRIKNFQLNTTDELDSHLEKMDYDLNDFKGLIVDLRDNPGGYLEQAIKISDRFLDRGIIVSTAGLSMQEVKNHTASWFNSIEDVPLVILVNNDSVSASEIVAAALKKNNRALVIGNRTYGKGSVQGVRELSSGSALKYTRSKYLTPGNISIQSVGVTPHIELMPYYVNNESLQIIPGKQNDLEDSLDQNFAEWGDKAESVDKTLFYLSQKADADDEDEFSDSSLADSLENDFWVQFSKKMLIKNSAKEFENFYKGAIDFADAEKRIQDERLIEKFSGFSIPVDWTTSSTQDIGKIASRFWIELKETKDDKEVWQKTESSIRADSEIRLHLEVKNTGETDIYRLLAISESENQIFDDRQFAFGKVKSNETKEWFFPIKISESSISRNNLISFTFTDQNNNEVHTSSTTFNTLGKERPDFYYDVSFFENGKHQSKGNADQILQAGETVGVHISVENKGKGKSGPIKVLLKSAEGKNVFLSSGKKSLKSINPGGKAELAFQFDFKAIPPDEVLDLSVDIIDETFSLKSVNQKIRVPVTQKLAAVTNKPPSIVVKTKQLTSSQKTIDISGEISDNGFVKDMYVFANKKKVYYKNYQLDKQQKVSFKISVSLDKDSNMIKLISRDNDGVSARKGLIIRYIPPQ